MKSEDVDRVLSDEPEIVPSSGFVGRVMEAVSAEASAPPLPFPWKRAWPLAIAIAGLLAWLPVSRLQPQSPASEVDLYAWFEMIAPMRAGWILSALIMSFALTVISLRMTRVR